MRSFEKSDSSMPCTISYVPFFTVHGKEETMPSVTP